MTMKMAWYERGAVHTVVKGRYEFSPAHRRANRRRQRRLDATLYISLHIVILYKKNMQGWCTQSLCALLRPRLLRHAFDGDYECKNTHVCDRLSIHAAVTAEAPLPEGRLGLASLAATDDDNYDGARRRGSRWRTPRHHIRETRYE